MADTLDLLTIPQVAEELHCSKTNVYQLIADRKLGHVPIGDRKGGRKLVSRDQLNAFVAAFRVDPT